MILFAPLFPAFTLPELLFERIIVMKSGAGLCKAAMHYWYIQKSKSEKEATVGGEGAAGVRVLSNKTLRANTDP